MKCLVIDVESSLHNPFARQGQLACVGTFDGKHYTYYDIEHSSKPYNSQLELVAQAIGQAEIIIGHNVKFDLHWLRRYIPTLCCGNVWDTMLFEYIASNQTWVLPSLNDSLIFNGLPGKRDTIKIDYWDKGIDTMQIPDTLLREYNEHDDCRSTYNLYLKQKDRLKPEQAALFQLHCDDLLVLQEMEFNGMIFDMVEAERMQKETQNRYDRTCFELRELIPHPNINWNSNDHLSAILYGGTIKFPVREIVTKEFKNGPKDVERWGTVTTTFPRLVEPLERTERDKKAGYYFVNEPNLRSLQPRTNHAKLLIEQILKLAEVEKLLNTYYIGLPKLISQMDWEPGVIHGQINQCVTKTGRSSSSKPNLQNFAGVIKPLFKSRYE